MRTDRLRDIEQYVLAREAASLESIAAAFGVSMNTVRRDIKQLVGEGRLVKVYGGVHSPQGNGALVPYQQRNVQNNEEKVDIARRAAACVEDKDIVFIDSGTTTNSLINFIPDDISITVITHSFIVMSNALPRENIRLISLSGELVRGTYSFCSPATSEELSNYNINKAFMASTSVSRAGDVTNSSPFEYATKKMAMEKSALAYLLIDSTKFGDASLFSYAKLSAFSKVFTSRGMDPAFLTLCEQMQVPVDAG